MRVVKKDGSEEDFVREKISVALFKNGLDINTARAIANAVENKFASKDKIASSEIREEVLTRLKDKRPDLYESWLSFESSKQ